jgi:hypothetical protein
MVAQSFVLYNATTSVTTCGDACDVYPVPEPEYTSPMPAVSVEQPNLSYPVKVFEVVGGAPATEIPCLAPCPPSGSVFQFALPPRATGSQPARVFRVMTMIGQVAALWPRDGDHTASPPFADETITWTNPGTNETTMTRLTGLVDHAVVPERTGCVRPIPGGCLRQGTLVPYRALRYATMTFATNTRSEYATAAAAALTPVQAAPIRTRLAGDHWTSSEGVLPRWP